MGGGKIFEGNSQLRLLPFGILTTAGLALLRSERVGLWVSIILQASQALAWHVGETTWRFCAGPFLSVTLFQDRTSIYAGWESSIAWGEITGRASGFVSFNLISFVLGYFLWRQVVAWRQLPDVDEAIRSGAE
jgi:hypothetical protein